MKIAVHATKDWCHLCGERSTPSVDVWYPENAEHSKVNTEYIRICLACSQLIARGLEGYVEGAAGANTWTFFEQFTGYPVVDNVMKRLAGN